MYLSEEYKTKGKAASLSAEKKRKTKLTKALSISMGLLVAFFADKYFEIIYPTLISGIRGDWSDLISAIIMLIIALFFLVLAICVLYSLYFYTPDELDK